MSWVRRAGPVAAAGLAACGLAVADDPGRAVLTVASLAAALVVAAVVSGWRLLGSLATVAAASATLLAAALDPSAPRPLYVLAATATILLFVGALERIERPLTAPRPDTLSTAPPARRLGVPGLALGAAAVVAVAAAQPVVPSVPLVVVGLAATVAALVVATRAG